MRRKRPKATTRLGEHVEGSVRLPRKKPGGRMTYALARSPLKEHGQGEAKGMALKRICRRIWEKTTSRRARGKTPARHDHEQRSVLREARQEVVGEPVPCPVACIENTAISSHHVMLFIVPPSVYSRFLH